MTEVADTLTHLCDAKAHSLRYSVREVNAIPVLCVCVCTHTSHHYRESVIILVTQHPCIWGCCGCIWWEARSRMSLYRSWTRELLPFLLKLPLGLKHIAQAQPIRDLTQEWWWGEAELNVCEASECPFSVGLRREDLAGKGKQGSAGQKWWGQTSKDSTFFLKRC